MRHITGWLMFGLAGAIALGAATPALAAPSPSPAAVREKKAEVFDRSEFKSGKGDSDWFLRTLRDFFDWLGSLPSVFFWLALIVCLALLVLLLVYIGYTVRRAFTGGRVHGASRGSHAERILLSGRYHAASRRQAELGEYTEAVRYLFLSLVYRFDEQGRVSLHEAYTNREYLEIFSDRAPLRAGLRVMVDILDDHWYGERPCDQRQYEQCLEVYQRLLAAV